MCRVYPYLLPAVLTPAITDVLPIHQASQLPADECYSSASDLGPLGGSNMRVALALALEIVTRQRNTIKPYQVARHRQQHGSGLAPPSTREAMISSPQGFTLDRRFY